MLPQYIMMFFNAFLHWTKINSSQSCELVGWRFSLFCLAQTLENKDQHLSWDSSFFIIQSWFPSHIGKKPMSSNWKEHISKLLEGWTYLLFTLFLGGNKMTYKCVQMFSILHERKNKRDEVTLRCRWWHHGFLALGLVCWLVGASKGVKSLLFCHTQCMV